MPHETAGWAVQQDYHYQGEMRDFKGTTYPLDITFNKYGFRKWGDPNSSKNSFYAICAVL